MFSLAQSRMSKLPGNREHFLFVQPFLSAGNAGAHLFRSDPVSLRR
jgi:hypothetical protein